MKCLPAWSIQQLEISDELVSLDWTYLLYQIADPASSSQVCKANFCLYTGTNSFLHGREVEVENQEARGGKPEVD